MTVNAVPSRIQYIAAPNQTDFDGSFTINDPQAIAVYRLPEGEQGNDQGALLIYLVDYTVEIDGDNGFTITLLKACDGGEIITLQSDYEISRIDEYGVNRPINSVNLNSDMDNNVLVSKQVSALQNQTCMRYSYSEYIPAALRVLPKLNPGYFWIMNSGGTSITQAPGPDEDSSAAQLRADLAASDGDTLVGNNNYGTVHQALDALINGSPRFAIDMSDTANSIEITISPTPEDPTQFLSILLANTNSSSSITVTNSGMDPIGVVSANGNPIEGGRMLSGTVYYFLYDGTNYRVLNLSQANLSAWPPMHINGIYCAPGDLDPINDVIFGVGSCRDLEDSINITVSSPVTKRKDATWAEGDGQGGAPAGQTYTDGDTVHRFIIAKADGVTDAGFDTDITGINLLASAAADGYLYIRRAGSGYIGDDDAWRPTERNGDYEFYLDDINNYSILVNSSTSISTVSLPIPLGLNLVVQVSATMDSVEFNNTTLICANGSEITWPSNAEGYAHGYTRDGESFINNVLINTNNLGQIQRDSQNSNGDIRIYVTGYVDKRDVI